MNTKDILFGFMFCSFITAAGLLHADIGQPAPESVLNHLAVIELAVSHPSEAAPHSPQLARTDI